MDTAYPSVLDRPAEAPPPLAADGPAAAEIDTPPEFLRLPVPPDVDAPDPSAAPAPEDGAEEVAKAGPRILALVAASSDRERPDDLPLVIESLLLVAEEPPTVRALAEATNVAADAVEAALATLQAEGASRGARIQRHKSTVRLVSAPEAAPFIQRFLGLERPNRLSKAALETLAIIAYRQPVTRAALESVRGVNCDGPLRTLRERELIHSVGQLDTPGRPHLWAPSHGFLEHFGLSDLDELPALPDLPPTVGQALLELETKAETADAPGPEPVVTSATGPVVASATGPAIDDERQEAPAELVATEYAAAGGD